jgi:hypothetical protein
VLPGVDARFGLVCATFIPGPAGCCLSQIRRGLPGWLVRIRNLPDNLRVHFGHCCHRFTDITAAGEDPIAVIQWRVQFVDRMNGRCQGNRMLVDDPLQSHKSLKPERQQT